MKINARYEPSQLNEYLRRGHVVGIVRRKGSAPERARQNKNWLGEVTWSELLPALRTMPLSGSVKDEWLSLLRLMEQDGEFAEANLVRATAADVELSHKVASRILTHLRRRDWTELSATRQRKADGLTRSLRTTKGFPGRRWGSVDIEDAHGNTYWRVGVRHAGRGTPELTVRWFPWNTRDANRRQRAMYEELQKTGTYTQMGTGVSRCFNFHRKVPVRPGSEGTSELSKPAREAIDAIIDVGLLNYDIDEWQPST
ncbi:MAG: hypothetical protein R2718_10005 [Solirubrobacterales bacterium]